MPLVKCYGRCGKTQDNGKGGEQPDPMLFGFFCPECRKEYLHYLGPDHIEVASSYHESRATHTKEDLIRLGKADKLHGIDPREGFANIYTCKDDFVHEDEIEREERRRRQQEQVAAAIGR